MAFRRAVKHSRKARNDHQAQAAHDHHHRRQRTNARNNAAKASRERHKRAKAGYDADAGIARLKAILDAMEGK